MGTAKHLLRSTSGEEHKCNNQTSLFTLGLQLQIVSNIIVNLMISFIYSTAKSEVFKCLLCLTNSPKSKDMNLLNYYQIICTLNMTKIINQLSKNFKKSPLHFELIN